MPRRFFRRNQRITASRAREILGKYRRRGPAWLARRVAHELRTPETTEGIYIRRLLAWGYGTLLFVLSPLLVLARLGLGLPGRSLYLFYDLDVSPVTYDVADALVLAELERRRRRLDRLFVVVVPGRRGGLRDEGGEYESVVDQARRKWRLHHLVVPMFALLPSCAGYSICPDRRQATLLRLLVAGAVYPPTYWPAFPLAVDRRPIDETARRGVPIFPLLRSPEQSLRYVRQWLTPRVGTRRAITITIRSYGVAPARNSNLAAWAHFARELDPDRFVPIFVLDTDTAMTGVPEAIRDAVVFSEAPWNLALRSALHELAYLNLAIVHGPTELLWYDERCRYVIFFPRSDPTTLDAAAANGFVAGESLPFATPFQRWVWAPDDLDTIRREFAAMCAVIEAAAGSAGP